MSRHVSAEVLEQLPWPGGDGESVMDAIVRESPGFAARLRRGGVGEAEWMRVMRPMLQALAEFDLKVATDVQTPTKVTIVLDLPPS